MPRGRGCRRGYTRLVARVGRKPAHGDERARCPVFHDLEVARREVVDVPAVLVGHDRHHLDQVDLGAERRLRLGLLRDGQGGDRPCRASDDCTGGRHEPADTGRRCTVMLHASCLMLHASCFMPQVCA